MSRINQEESLVDLNLSETERLVFGNGLRGSIGPWIPRDKVAKLLGYNNGHALKRDILRLSDLAEGGAAMSEADWNRLVRITEVVALTNFGNRADWAAVSGTSAHDALSAIERIEDLILND